MKIAIWHNLPSGGGKRALYLHVRGLVERGHHVEAWTTQTSHSTYLPLSELIPEHVVHFGHVPYEHSNPIQHAMRSLNRVTVDMERMEQACAEAAQAMRQGGFDVLFANTDYYYFAPPIARVCELPNVLYLQEPNRLLYEARPHLPWVGPDKATVSGWKPAAVKARIIASARQRKSRLYARYERRNALAFDMLLVNSYFSRESVLRSYGRESNVCYLGIDTTNFVNQHLPREDFVIGIGALQAHKNVEFVIKAVGAMRGRKPSLVWIGNLVAPEYRAFLEELARSEGVCLELKIMVSDAEMVDLLNRAALMVYAPRLEPFGYAPLEANACGLPVVAVAEGGVRETVVDGINGLLVGGEPKSMAAAIEKLLQNPTQARELGETGCRLVHEKWTLTSATERLEHYLQQTIQAAKVAD